MKTDIKLSVMMFLQFMMLPVWFVPMFPYVQTMPGGADWALWCGFIMFLFIVGAQMFVNDHAPKALRNQAQGLMNLVTAGLGVFASNTLFNALLGSGVRRWTLCYLVALTLALLVALAAAALLKRKAA